MLILHKPALVLFILLTAIYFASTSGGVNSGDGSSYALTKSLGESLTVKIDRFKSFTYDVDFARVKGHYYLDREPGLSFLSLPFYVLAKILSPFAFPPYAGTNPVVDSESILQSLTYLTTAVFGSLAVVFLFLICRSFGASKWISFLSALVFGLGTLNWKYSAGYFREPVLTSFLLASVYLLILPLPLKKLKSGFWVKAISGFLFGMGLFADYSKFYLFPFFLLYLFFRNISQVKYAVSAFLLGVSVPLIFIFSYNFRVFNNPFTNPHLHKTYFRWMSDPALLFSIPLIPGIRTNLISNGPIAEDVLVFFKNNPSVAEQYAVELYHTWMYKGILVQTPLLILAIFGWFFIFRKKFWESLLFIICAVSIFVSTSKLTVFWGSINQDGRYFLPVVALLFPGLAVFINESLKIRNRFVRNLLILVTVFLSIISVYNGWYSNITQFAPKNTGFYRFNYSSLSSPLFSLNNLKLILINTFPNFLNTIFLIPLYAFISHIPVRIFKNIKTRS